MKVFSSLLWLCAAITASTGVAAAQGCLNNMVTNGDFSSGLVPGSMPAGSVSNWSLITNSPQVVTDGCQAPGSLQMWGNRVVGESVKHQLTGPGFRAGTTYRVTVCYRWLDNNPILPQYVRFRLAASAANPAVYPASAAYSVIGTTPNTSSTAWTSYTFPLWTAPANMSWLTINPENDSVVNHGDFVSWGLIDDVCIEEVPCDVVANGHFTNGLVPGSMPGGSVTDWSLLTQSPQVVTDGCEAPGSLQMWGNLAVGESVYQTLPGAGFKAGTTYRISVCYRWLDNNPVLPQYVRFRLGAASAVPGSYPPLGGTTLIGTTPNTNSTTWTSYTFPDWTAPSNAGWITVNPENNSNLNNGNFVSWGLIDDICVLEVPCRVVANGHFTDGLVPGSMPGGAVTDWSVLTATPQVVTDGCDAPGSLQMWGNLVVGESVQQLLPGAGIQAGRTYRFSVCYRWLDNNPILPQYVRFRLSASAGPPGAYPPIGGYTLIGSTPNTSSVAWQSYTFPDWTAPINASWITVNPENNETMNHGDFVSWGLIDDICVVEVTRRRIGLNYCTATAVANSTGAASAIEAYGSDLTFDNDLVLTVRDLPLSAFGYFLTSRQQGLIMNPGGSQGILCLLPPIGRAVGGSILNSGMLGTVFIAASVNNVPTPTGPVTVTPGETWNFQYWHRDAGATGATSNLSDAVSILFQ